MINSVFVKCMENVTMYMEMKLTTKEKMAVAYFSKNTFKGDRYIDGLYMVEFYKKEIIYNEPINVGTSILDL